MKHVTELSGKYWTIAVYHKYGLGRFEVIKKGQQGII